MLQYLFGIGNSCSEGVNVYEPEKSHTESIYQVFFASCKIYDY